MELGHDQEVALLDLEHIALSVMAMMLNLEIVELRKHVSYHLL